MTAPRVTGLVAAGHPLPMGVPVELYVEIAGTHDHYPAGMARLDLELTDLIGDPVIVAHCPVRTGVAPSR